ncbi:RmlC-like cupin domain-containing protein [Echria macrotheca]|uniref:RmlC-like cupin domain-containing protein n=1 Tax=Echria macrotheca TaxID=438768 RepID=A0AAJ0F448_9PEZI|nr:RmlC-like cupin domain-containing protein [Echria macrotheca]
MAALLPIFQEIFPMLLPGPISVSKATDIAPLPPSPAPGETTNRPRARVINQDAVINKTDKMCATVLIVKPRSRTTIRHNAEQDAIIYAVSGTGVLLWIPNDEEVEEEEKPERQIIEKGDFAFIPAWREHQVLNESKDQDLHWVVIRSGPAPVEVDLLHWGGEVKDPPQQR